MEGRRWAARTGLSALLTALPAGERGAPRLGRTWADAGTSVAAGRPPGGRGCPVVVRVQGVGEACGLRDRAGAGGDVGAGARSPARDHGRLFTDSATG